MAYTRETVLLCRSALIGLLVSLAAMAESNITWTNFGFYAEADGNGIQKVSPPTDWVSGPHSEERIDQGAFFLEFPITEVTTHRHIGFGPKPSVSDHYSAMDFSIRLDPNGSTAKAVGYRGGTRFLTLVEVGDILRIQLMNRTISIYHNDLHLADKDYPEVDVNYPTYVDTSLYSVGASFSNVTFGPHAGDAPAFLSVIASDPDDADNDYGDGDVITLSFDRDTGSPEGSVDELFVFSYPIGDVYSGAWSDDGRVFTITIDDSAGAAPPRISTIVTGAEASPFEMSPASLGMTGSWGGRDVTWRTLTNIQLAEDGALSKSGPSSDWNAAAFGRDGIVNLPNRFGFFEGRVPHDNRKLVLGLSDGGIAVKLQDIDFGLLVTVDRTLRIYEYGAEVFQDRPLKPGDLLRIEVEEDGSIHYLHNDVEVHESVHLATTLPLTPNVAIESVGGSLIDVRISLPNPLPPRTEAIWEEVAEEATLSGSVSAVDPEDEAVTVILLDDVDEGTLQLNQDGSYTYTGDTDFVGEDRFSFRAEDPGGLSSGETWVTITVTNVNDRPTVPDERISHRAEAYSLNGFDADGDSLTYKLLSFPHPFLEASVAIVGTHLIVRPADGFTGEIELDYSATDTNGWESVPGTLTIVVGWQLDIEVRNASVRRLTIGMDGEASERRHPPASPDDGTLAYLGDNSPRAQSPFTSKILEHAISGSWTLNVDVSTGSEDVGISWNPDLVPDNGLFLLRNDTITNMSRVREITVPAGEVHVYEIRYGLRAQEIVVGTGWSLVSVPLDPLDSDPAVVFSGIPGFTIFAWDGQAYINVSAIKAGVGYWVLNAGQFAVTKEIIGHANETPQALSDGWNLMGVKGRHAPGIESAFTNPETIEEIWGYTNGVYSETTLLDLGAAYWIYSTLP
ncbi:MAG: hypothetical protein ACI8W8_001229 [Rhodothermales bacterium]|jgi:hypothetical protein